MAVTKRELSYEVIFFIYIATTTTMYVFTLLATSISNIYVYFLKVTVKRRSFLWKREAIEHESLLTVCDHRHQNPDDALLALRENKIKGKDRMGEEVGVLVSYLPYTCKIHPD